MINRTMSRASLYRQFSCVSYLDYFCFTASRVLIISDLTGSRVVRRVFVTLSFFFRYLFLIFSESRRDDESVLRFYEDRNRIFVVTLIS